MMRPEDYSREAAKSIQLRHELGLSLPDEAPPLANQAPDVAPRQLDDIRDMTPCRPLRRGDLAKEIQTSRQRIGEVSSRLLATVRQDLTTPAFEMLTLLHLTALVLAQRRGYSTMPDWITFLLPQEVLAKTMGIKHRATIGKYRRELQELGLIDARPHKTTLWGQTVNDGYLWAVKVRPVQGKAPRLAYEDFKHRWRDLSGDIQQGRTAFNEQIEQSEEGLKTTRKLEKILAWTLPPVQNQSPLGLTVQNPLECVLDVPMRSKAERAEWVNLAAQALASALGDRPGNLDFYRWLMWNLLRLSDQGQDYFQQIYTLAVRARADTAEGFARAGGALFTSRLKRLDVWELIRSIGEQRAMTRVGTRPLRA